jgi:PAS domain S-box-containing protein
MTENVTDEINQQVEIRLSYFDALLDSTSESIVIIDRLGIMEIINPAAARLFAYDIVDMQGQNVSMLMKQDERAGHQLYVDNSGIHETRIINRMRELQGLRKDGSLFPLELSVSPMETKEGKKFIGIMRDISERKKQYEELLFHDELQTSYNTLLQISTEATSLEDKLDKAFNSVLDISWLSLMPKGGIFIVDEPQTLRLVVEKNLDENISKMCSRVPFGKCLCGKAAKMRETQYAGHVDHRHEITFDGMADHGHYNIPLISDGEVIGVFLLYLPLELKLSRNMENFLKDAAQIITTIIEQNNSVEALIEARRRAEDSNKAKSVFLSHMSHELRTPLNSILGFSQLLDMDQQNPLTADQKDSVEHISSSGKHLLTLLDEILDLAKIESGKLEISIEDINVGQIMKEVTELLSNQASKSQVTLHNQIESNNNIFLRADYTRLKQALLNLLSNAIKYNKENGDVFLSMVLQENEKLRITIVDTGIGIPEENLPYIFDPFDRLGLDNSQIEGTGIGLTITKRIVELMHGTIGVTSTLNKGSTFWVEFEMSDETFAQLKQMEHNIHESTGNQDKEQQNQCNKVLYIEDNPNNMGLMRQILSKCSQFELLEAETAERGLEIAYAEKPDIILMDIGLPGMSGFAALEILKDKGLTNNITVIALSANATKEDIKKGKEAGFFDYLTKPIDIPKLIEVLNSGISIQ